MPSTAERRAARLAENEARFRARNESVKEVAFALSGPEGKVAFVCECAHEDCSRAVTLSGAEYERVRAYPTRFVVYPGHEVEEIERCVHANARFCVVEKTVESARRVAEETDPRH